MPKLSLDALLRAAQRGEPLAPVIYLYGAEDLLKEEAIRAVIDHALDPGLRDFNLDQRSAGQLDPEAVYSLCNTPPMMAERRVVVIRDVEAWKRKAKAKETFLAYLERPSPDSIVLLVQGAGEENEDKELAQRAASVECEPLNAERAAKWVRHHAKGKGITVDAGAAEHLVRVVGTDLAALAAEVEKLSALAGDDPIDTDRLADIVGVRHGETKLDWRNAVLDGDTARATRLLGPVLAQSGVSGVSLVTMLGTTLVGVSVARSFHERNQRGSQLENACFNLIRRSRVFGLQSWGEESKCWARWAAAWSAPRLRHALRAALAADTALKNTTISDEHGILLDLVLKLTVHERKAA
jgi:DNA polymerase-3 subunit delta